MFFCILFVFHRLIDCFFFKEDIHSRIIANRAQLPLPVSLFNADNHDIFVNTFLVMSINAQNDTA